MLLFIDKDNSSSCIKKKKNDSIRILSETK